MAKGFDKGGFGYGVSITPSPSVSPISPRVSPLETKPQPAAKAGIGIGAVSKITGQSFNVAKLNTGDMITTPQSYTPGTVKQNLQTASAHKSTIQQTMGAFDKALSGVQAAVADKFIQVADRMGYDGKGLMASMAPSSSASTMNAAAQIGLGMAMSPAVGAVMTVIDSIAAAMKSGGANPKQIERVMAQVKTEMIAQQNQAMTMQGFLGGAISTAPAYKVSRVTPQEMQDLLFPQNQPEKNALQTEMDKTNMVLANNEHTQKTNLNDVTVTKAIEVARVGNTNDMDRVLNVLSEKPMDAGTVQFLTNFDMRDMTVNPREVAKMVSAENKPPAPGFNLEAQLAAAAPRPTSPGFAFGA